MKSFHRPTSHEELGSLVAALKKFEQLTRQEVAKRFGRKQKL